MNDKIQDDLIDNKFTFAVELGQRWLNADCAAEQPNQAGCGEQRRVAVRSYRPRATWICPCRRWPPVSTAIRNHCSALCWRQQPTAVAMLLVKNSPHRHCHRQPTHRLSGLASSLPTTIRVFSWTSNHPMGLKPSVRHSNCSRFFAWSQSTWPSLWAMRWSSCPSSSTENCGRWPTFLSSHLPWPIWCSASWCCRTLSPKR